MQLRNIFTVVNSIKSNHFPLSTIPLASDVKFFVNTIFVWAAPLPLKQINENSHP